MAVKNRNTRAKKRSSDVVENAHDTINESVSAIEQQLKEITTDTKTRQHRHNGLKKSIRNSRSFIFLFGALIGVAVAVYFGAASNVSDLDTLVNFTNLNDYLEDWKDVVPLGLQNIIGDLQRSDSKARDFTESFAVGMAMKSEHDLHAKHPVIMVPGVISTGLESWGLEGTPSCPSKPHFRKRLWGTMYMLRTMFLDKACWLKHIMLDPETGLDPPGIKLRAAQGFESVDYFMVGYWLWSKILENLSVIGYEPNTMVTASYDWRLAFLDLERRDRYFSKLKEKIELQYQTTGEKATLVGHSMGSQVIYYFMKWVEAEGESYGNGGSNWVNTYVDSYVDISGSILGAPKAVPALLSGEMKDTVQLNALAVYGLEKFFSRRERLDMLRTFGGIASMIPKGGDLFWGGNGIKTFEDSNNVPESHIETFSEFIKFNDNNGDYSNKSYTLDDSIKFVLDESPDWFQERVENQYSYGVASSLSELQANNHKHSKWSNPLEAPLPNAPDLKIFCFYGFGNPTERAYIYEEEKDKKTARLNVTIAQGDSKNPAVFLTDGDGTIPLMTHAMCHKWKTSKALNPGGAKVKVVELKHEPDRFDIRGGAQTAEHVDILGSAKLNELILKVVSGRDDLIEEKIVTGLKDWVDDIELGFD